MTGASTVLARMALAAALGWPAAAGAVNPGEQMADPALELRARALYGELRCVVCQNQSIDSSDAEIAADMRALVRARLEQGDSDQAVRDAMVLRYGTYVLLEPPMQPLTYALWFGPPAVLLAGIVGIAVWRRRGRVPAGAAEDERPLTDAERLRLAELMDSDDREQRA
ncbi:MAG: cytochrome c-type biogenesis protein [Alphaproteobacteria bacterium]